MTTVKISEMTAAAALDGTEKIPVVQSGASVRTTAQAIANLAAGTLDGLTDVTIAAPTTGQVLKYSGSAWVNGTPGAQTDFSIISESELVTHHYARPQAGVWGSPTFTTVNMGTASYFFPSATPTTWTNSITRLDTVTSTAVDVSAGWRCSSSDPAIHMKTSNAVGRPWVIRFTFGLDATRSGQRLMIGLHASTSAPTANVDPSALSWAWCGLAKDEADANISFMRNIAGGTATKQDLGIAITVLEDKVCTLTMSGDASGTTGSVDWDLHILETDVHYTGSTGTTNTPDTNTLLYPVSQVNTGHNTSTAVRIINFRYDEFIGWT